MCGHRHENGHHTWTTLADVKGVRYSNASVMLIATKNYRTLSNYSTRCGAERKQNWLYWTRATGAGTKPLPTPRPPRAGFLLLSIFSSACVVLFSVVLCVLSPESCRVVRVILIMRIARAQIMLRSICRWREGDTRASALGKRSPHHPTTTTTTTTTPPPFCSLSVCLSHLHH